MKSYAKIFVILGISLFLGGCGDMLRSLRQESLAIDEEAEYDRSESENLERLASRPRPLRGVTANNVNAYDPPVRREYGRRLASAARNNSYPGQHPDAPKRYTRADFVDTSAQENSLWDGGGQGNYLFTHNRRREVGDLLAVEVERELRREIQYSLWLSLPPEFRRRPTRKPASEDKAPGFAKTGEDGKSQIEQNKDAAEEAAKTDVASNGKEDDIVRMEVVEHLGNGLVRLVGQKRVIHRGTPKMVEVSALVNNKDINDQNQLKSSAFLDLQAQVVQ